MEYLVPCALTAGLLHHSWAATNSLGTVACSVDNLPRPGRNVILLGPAVDPPAAALRIPDTIQICAYSVPRSLNANVTCRGWSCISDSASITCFSLPAKLERAHTHACTALGSSLFLVGLQGVGQAQRSSLLCS